MDFAFCPGEGLGCFVVAFDEGIDVLDKLVDGLERCAGERFSLQNRKPDFDLIEPACLRRCEMEFHIGMFGKPVLILLACLSALIRFSIPLLRNFGIRECHQ